MRNRSIMGLAGFIFLLTLAANSQAAPPEAASLKAMTYNVHGSTFCAHGVNQCKRGIRKLDYNRLKQLVDDSGARVDVIALQELYKIQADDLATKLLGRPTKCYEDSEHDFSRSETRANHTAHPHNCYFVASNLYPGANFGNAIFSFQQIIATEAVRIHTEHDPQVQCGKVPPGVTDEFCAKHYAKLTGVTLKVVTSGVTRLVRAYDVHLTANPSDKAEHEHQVNWQVGDVLKAISKDQSQAQGTFRALLLGDFNTTPTGTPNSSPINLVKTKFIDAWENGTHCRPDASKDSGFTEPAPTTRNPNAVPTRRIDYIFLYQNNIFSISCVKVMRPETCTGTAPNERCMSDHLPVVASLSFH